MALEGSGGSTTQGDGYCGGGYGRGERKGGGGDGKGKGRGGGEFPLREAVESSEFPAVRPRQRGPRQPLVPAEALLGVLFFIREHDAARAAPQQPFSRSARLQEEQRAADQQGTDTGARPEDKRESVEGRGHLTPRSG